MKDHFIESIDQSIQELSAVAAKYNEAIQVVAKAQEELQKTQQQFNDVYDILMGIKLQVEQKLANIGVYGNYLMQEGINPTMFISSVKDVVDKIIYDEPITLEKLTSSFEELKSSEVA